MFDPKHSLLGTWLTTKPAVLKIDKLIFAHGGIVDLGNFSVETYNEQVVNFMHEPAFLDLLLESPDTTKYTRLAWEQQIHFFYSTTNPFWYRGYVQSDTLNAQLSTMLRKYRAKTHVVAHTPLKSITQKYKGKLLTTDLEQAATELLFLTKHGKKYNRFKIDSEGLISELE
jgi:hypothetical protein